MNDIYKELQASAEQVENYDELEVLLAQDDDQQIDHALRIHQNRLQGFLLNQIENVHGALQTEKHKLDSQKNHNTLLLEDILDTQNNILMEEEIRDNIQQQMQATEKKNAQLQSYISTL